MIAAILIALAAALALAYVAAPLRRGPRRDLPGTGLLAEEADAKKRAALGAIVDLEQERDAGKLSDTDFAALRAEYEAQALAALKELDVIQSSTGDGDAIEREIAAVRQKMACPSCGAARLPGESCPKCGA